MALRKPLVLVNGQTQQLQAGDTLDAPQSGGDQIVRVNNDTVAIVIGTPVYTDAPGSVKRAQANAALTMKVLGLVGVPTIAVAASSGITINGPLTATTAQWDVVTGQTGGLTTGSYYWLDAATPGKLTSTAPSTVGQYVAQVGIAISTTELNIDIQSTVLL